MIKTLQKKFIFTSMAAITVLIAVLLGGINIFNIRASYRQSKSTLDFLVSSTVPERPTPPGKGLPPDGGSFDFRPPEADRQQSALYFKISEDAGGNIIHVDVSRIPSVTKAEAEAICGTVTGSEGKTGEFLYKTRLLPENLGKEIYFLSLSEQNYAALRVALLSLGAGVICWGLMLLLIALLSRRAIRPIAENLEKQKRFITDAGHEIKTPLAVIMANTEALELHHGSNKWIENMKAQTLRLSGLMQQLLLLAKVDGEEAPTKKETVNLSDTVCSMTEAFGEPARQRGLTLDSRIENGITVQGDAGQLTSLISVLLDNAVKYAAENTTVAIVLKKDKNIRFTVENQCDALPDCSPETLFDRFYRGDDARTQKNGGCGIGLSAAKAVAEHHGGRIAASYIGKNAIRFAVIL